MKLLCEFKNSRSHMLLLVAGAIVISLLTVYMFTGSKLMFHSDSASAVTLSMEMIRTGSIWPESWVGSTGIYIAHYPIWLALHFVDDLMLAKSIGQTIWLALFLIGIFCLSRKVLKNNSWICMLPILCTYFSITQYDMIFVQGAYMGTLCLMFYVVSAYTAATKSFVTWEWDRKKLILFFAILLVACSAGIILLQAVVVPILGASIWIYLQNNYRKAFRELDVSSLRRLLTISVGIVLTAMAGCSIYFYAAKRTHLTGNTGMTTLVSSFEQIADNLSLLIQGFFSTAGLSNNIGIFSVDGILSVGRIIVFTALTVIFPVFAYRKYRQEKLQVQFFLIFTAVHVLEVLILLIITNGGYDASAMGRYLLTSIVLLQIVSINYIYTYYLQSKNILSALTALAVSAFAVMSMFTVCEDIVEYKDQYSEMKGVSEFLLQHDLKYGYATFWNAGKNTVLSNGNVQINAVSYSENKVIPQYWLSSEDWYDPDYFSDNTFLMLTEEELALYAPDGVMYTNLGEAQQILQYEDYTILIYDYNISENGFGGKLTGNVNLLPRMSTSDESMKMADGTIQVQPGQILFGPYLTLDAGEYILKLDAECQEEQPIRITAKSGQIEITNATLHQGSTEITFSLDENTNDIEFVIDSVSMPVQITKISLERVG